MKRLLIATTLLIGLSGCSVSVGDNLKEEMVCVKAHDEFTPTDENMADPNVETLCDEWVRATETAKS